MAPYTYRFTKHELGAFLLFLVDKDLPLALACFREFAETSLSTGNSNPHQTPPRCIPAPINRTWTKLDGSGQWTCQQGGRKMPKKAATLLEKESWQQQGKAHIQGLSNVHSLAVTLSTANMESALCNPLDWAHDLKSSLHVHSLCQSDSLPSLLAQCSNLTGKNVSVNFFVMVSRIQLVAACQR